MFKTLISLIAGAVFLLGVSAVAQAQSVHESSETDDLLNAVGEVTTTLRADPFSTLSVFLNGTYVATANLQREVGSPGSGAFENVRAVTNGTDDATVSTLWTTGPNPESYRVIVTTHTSGAMLAQLTDQSQAPTQFVSGATYIREFDDFLLNVAAVTAERYVATENDAGGTIFIGITGLTEGAYRGITGTGGDDADEVCLSYNDVSDMGGLVSDGTMAFEVRLKSNVTTAQFGALLHDEECVATQLTPFDVDSNVVTFDTGNQANSVGFAHSEEADDVDGWTAVSANADTEGNNSDEFEVGTVVANTYVTLRIEVDSSGDAYWYVDSVLVYAENEVVATTAILLPFVWADTTAADGGDPTIDVDFIEFVMTRPSS